MAATLDSRKNTTAGKRGDRNAFIDPAGYKAYIADRQQAFESELNRQSSAKP